MKVKWTPMAKGQLLETAKYILNKFGINAKDGFVEEVKHTSSLLELSIAKTVVSYILLLSGIHVASPMLKRNN